MTDKPQTLNEALLYWAEKTPDKTFIQSEKDIFSFLETQTIVENTAGFLVDRGVPEGAKICFLLPRTPELIFSFLAATRTNCLPAPVNYLENFTNIQKIISTLEPAVIIMDETAVREDVQDVIRKYGTLVISVNSPVNDRTASDTIVTWEHCARHTTRPGIPIAVPHATGPEDLAYLNFTTGSSGSPKGALCTHANLYWNTRSAVETFQLTEQDIHLCMFASFSHPHELFCRALYTGGSLVLLTKISPKAIVKAINRYHVTCMMGLAVMYKMMAEHCGGTVLPSLRIAESGGMFTTPEIHKRFLAVFQLPILSVWGSTETTGVALANSPKNYRTDGSMGRPCPHYRIKLVDSEGREVPDGEIGEMIFSGSAVVSGYNNYIAFPSKEGWYYSGDLARRDENGRYSFVERKSGMIKVAGLKVYPLQVELVMQTHPDVKEVAVVGVNEKRRGCIPKAFIATVDNVTLDIEKLQKYSRDRLAAYMVPKEFQQLDSLPKIGSGKINKKELIALPR